MNLNSINMADCQVDSNLPWQIMYFSTSFYIMGTIVCMIRSTIARQKQTAANHEIALSQQQNSIDDITYSSGTQTTVHQVEGESKEVVEWRETAEAEVPLFTPFETVMISDRVNEEEPQSNGEDWSKEGAHSKETVDSDEKGCCCFVAVKNWTKNNKVIQWMKDIGPDTWSMMKIYCSPTLHIADTITDYSTTVAFYLAAENTTAEDCG